MERAARKERDYQLRRGEILRQAEKIFSAKGFRRATMAEIAGSSGYAVGTIYQIFKGKEHLYTSMVSEKIARMIADIRASVEAADTTIGKIRALVDAHFRFAEDNVDFCRLFLLGEAMAISEAMTMLREKMIRTYFDHIRFIERFVAEGIRSGALKAMDARAVTSALGGMINAFTFDWIVSPGGLPLRARAASVLDIFLKGVAGNER